MLIHATKPLFPWDELEVSPTLATIKQALTAIPDAQLLASLNERRHNGCDTYPVSVLWGYCYDTVSKPPVRRAMSYAGHETRSRDTEVSLPGGGGRLPLCQRHEVQRG